MGIFRWRFGLLLVVLVVLGFFAFGPGFFDDETETGTGEQVDENGDEPEMAPDFVLADLEGEEHRLLDYRGQVVVLNFWTTTCSFCLQQISEMEQLEEDWDQVRVLAVNVGESASAVEELVASEGYQVQVLLDDGEVASEYGVHGVPVTAVIDADGHLQAFVQGYQSRENLEQFLQPLV